jgi:hypothetical protein
MNDLITIGSEIKSRIINEVSKSTECINLAMAWFTDKDIAKAIIDANNRGVKVEVILSSNQQNDTVRKLFEENGVKVYAFETGDSRGIMHHKFCLIDNKTTINGSFNYSYNASTNNVENILVSDDLKTFTQFIDEFERLKYNINHKLDLENNNMIPESIEVKSNVNPIEEFRSQLHHLVFSSTELDTESYKRRGYEKSKENLGHIDIFRTEFDRIKEEINVFATDESLGSKKQLLRSNIANAYENSKAKMQNDKQTQLETISRNFEIEVKQTTNNLFELKEEKNILESGNQNTGDDGLLIINKKIEKINLEKTNLEQSLIVKKFWNVGTCLSLGALFIFGFYLSIFFASALYKLFFEGNKIRNAVDAGLTPSSPPIVEANAIPIIFSEHGIIFGIVATLFFLIPILLSNIELFGKQKEWIKNLSFWSGILIFDILVAMMIAINKNYIDSLLNGGDTNFKIWQVFTKGEFWLIFVFGMLPLIITHYIITYLSKSYKYSQPGLIDSEKTNAIHFKDIELIELNAKRQDILNKIEEKEQRIKENKSRLNQIEININHQNNQIEDNFSNYSNQIKFIFDEFNSRIISGQIFTEDILRGIISAYKSGYIDFFPEYFSGPEIANRVREIERTIQLSK